MGDARPAFAHHRINWEILAKPDVLRRLIEEGRGPVEIGVMAGCHEATVRRWMALFGISRRQVRRAAATMAPAGPSGMPREQFRWIVARAYLKRGLCWPNCPHRERCLDDDGDCPYA